MLDSACLCALCSAPSVLKLNNVLSCLCAGVAVGVRMEVNDEATIARMVSIGVGAIVTGYPERIPHAH